MKMEPLAEGNETFWSGEPRIQYPGALVELVCWDSTATILISRDHAFTHAFRNYFPEAADMVKARQR